MTYNNRMKAALAVLVVLIMTVLSVWMLYPLILRQEAVAPAHVSQEIKRSTAPWLSEPITDPVPAETLVHGATIDYYEISGNTINELKDSIMALGPGRSGMPATTAYHLVLHKGDPADGVCGYSKAHIRAEITVLLPRWTPMSQATDEARQWWSYSFREWSQEQQKHIDTAFKEAQVADGELVRRDCASGDLSYAQINRQLLASHPAVDFPAAVSDIVFQTPGAVVEAVAAAPPLPSTLPNKTSAAPVRSPMNFSGITLRPMEGLSSPLEDYRGRVIFLNFWATWCGPCRTEMPSLASLYSKIKNEPVFFAAVSRENPNVVKNYLSKSGLNLPVYGMSDSSMISEMVSALPTTLILSKKGDIVLRRTGSMDWDNPETLKLIRDLENE